jgi:hypothetical protein
MDGSRVERFSLRGRQAAARINDITAHEQRIWLLGFDGLWSIDARADAETPAVRAPFSDQLSDQILTSAVWQTPTRLWVATRNGLNRVDTDSNTVVRIMAAPGDPSALQSSVVRSLLIDRRQRVWVVTSNGLHRMDSTDAARPRFQQVRLGDLQAPTILAAVQAGDGTIWLSTSAGLVAVDPDTLAARVLRSSDGVFNQFRTENAACVTPEGELLFGGVDGITVVRPERLQPWEFNAPVVVTDLRIGNRHIAAERFDSASSSASALVMSPEERGLSVEFAALDYTASPRNRYLYRLEGYDHDWISTPANVRTASYTDLPPGEFTLHLRASNRESRWSDRDIVIPIHVLPPWYRTAWAFVL